MRKALLFIPVAFLFISTVALADAVSVTSQTSFLSPNGPTIQSADWVGFQGPWTITFTVAGKTCNLNGSARGSVPTGCNYAITVASDGFDFRRADRGKLGLHPVGRHRTGRRHRRPVRLCRSPAPRSQPIRRERDFVPAAPPVRPRTQTSVLRAARADRAKSFFCGK
jgi:hypothetical protein